ncbi:MAG: hypothetical protein IPJ39_16865 [Saprospiraceae bacterium]|nr:hypothetical protein [Saprospiraceae bacterium]
MHIRQMVFNCKSANKSKSLSSAGKSTPLDKSSISDGSSLPSSHLGNNILSPDSL